jgi:Tol biopolymer transport system component
MTDDVPTRAPEEADAGMEPRRLRPGQRSQVWVADVDHDEPSLLLETADLLVEAPNWSADGRSLLLNGDGRLFALALEDADLAEVAFEGLPPINNDHVLAPGGEEVLLSAMDGHLYVGPLAGGAVRRLSEEDGMLHYLHGVSPDGATLAYVAIPREGSAPGRLALMPATGGAGTLVDTGPGHLDGPEYSPDGRWILFNTEGFTTEPGHAQLARIPAAGGAPERLVESGTVDWFPHLSPDGRYATYLAFPPGTEGHPADLDVEVRLVATDDWATPLRRYPLFGGQGTLNVNGWAPDSRRFAFVAYPVATG